MSVEMKKIILPDINGNDQEFEVVDEAARGRLDDHDGLIAIKADRSDFIAEMQARVIGDNVLSARMDTFTNLPDGSTSGDAELMDIRVSADGTTYPTAGDSVRGQLGELKSDLNNVVSEGNAFVTTNVKKGYWTVDEVYHTSSGICCVLDWVIADYDYYITFPVGYRIGVITYHEGGNTTDGWKTQPYFIAKGTKYLANFSTVNQDSISNANEFVKVYRKTTYLTDLTNKIETNALNEQYQTVALSQTGAYPVTEEVELGQYDSSGNKTSNNARVRSKGLISYPYDITITSIKPYRFLLLIKNGDSYTSTGWVYTYTVSANTEFLITCEDNTGNPVSDVHEFITHYPIGSYAQTNINAIKKKVGRTNQLFVTPRFEGIAHRGLRNAAPENTAPALIEAKKQRFKGVEIDLRWTSDGMAVICHDSSINRVARNSDGTEIASDVYISSTTYNDLLQYSFCMVNDEYHSEYLANKILTFEEALIICKKLGLWLSVEIKSAANITDTNLKNAVSLIHKYGFDDNIVINSYHQQYLNQVIKFLERPRIVLNVDTYGTTEWDKATSYILSLKEQGCEVYLALFYSAINDDSVGWAASNDIPIMAFTLDTEELILAVDPYVTYILSNSLNATEVFEKEMFDLLPSEN